MPAFARSYVRIVVAVVAGAVPGAGLLGLDDVDGREFDGGAG